VIKDADRKEALSVAANNQGFIADASMVIVALGDPGPASSAKMPYKLSSTRIAHRQDPIIAIKHMILAATALGYGTCWIGAFNAEEVKKIVEVPENLAVVALLPIGVPDESPPSRPRKAFEEIFFEELYGKPLKI